MGWGGGAFSVVRIFVTDQTTESSICSGIGGCCVQVLRLIWIRSFGPGGKGGTVNPTAGRGSADMGADLNVGPSIRHPAPTFSRQPSAFNVQRSAFKFGIF
jgi:hypothetical protein